MNNNSLSMAVAKVIDAANAHSGRTPGQLFRAALEGLGALEEAEIRSRVGAALQDITSASGAGFVTIWLGAGVEHGADPFPQIQPLLDCFLRFTRQVTIEDEEIVEGESEDVPEDELAVGLELLGVGLVAHLSRDLKSLRDIQANTGIVAELERVESYSPGPMWILELIRKVSGNLIVLHGEQPVGARLEYRNLSNCFHLFTLLQGALAKSMPGARKADPGILAVARGEYQEQCSDEAWWHYGQPFDGAPDLISTVFGEQSPQEIHVINGQQVMLLWPPILTSRTWDAGFFGPALHAAPAEVELIETLSPEDVTAWRQRIGLPEIR